ncbi:MAG: hypothetical protein F6K26_42185 [Moorea sp. SIO2I5]|nr:hypothetical protein [Moorena sp. SIO2I5]
MRECLFPVPVLMQSASGGNHGKARVGETTAKREWGEPPREGAASPRPRCLPKTALHRYSLLPVPCSLLPAPCSLFPVPFAI